MKSILLLFAFLVSTSAQARVVNIRYDVLTLNGTISLEYLFEKNWLLGVSTWNHTSSVTITSTGVFGNYYFGGKPRDGGGYVGLAYRNINASGSLFGIAFPVGSGSWIAGTLGYQTYFFTYVSFSAFLEYGMISGAGTSQSVPIPGLSLGVAF